MTREYNVIDADGHILEPPDLWQRYSDPKYRESCPKLVIDAEGNESFFVDENFDFGLRRHGKEPATLGVLGSIGSRGGEGETRMPDPQGGKGWFRPACAHRRHGARGHRRRLPLSQPRPVPGRNEGSGRRGGGLPRVQ